MNALTRLNWLDIVLLLIVGVSTFRSARRGFSREVIGLASSVFALVLAMWFYGTAGSYLQPYVSSPAAANFLGFLLVAFAVLLLGGLLGWIVNRMIRTIGLSFFDHALGALFGFVRGALIATILLTAWMSFSPWLPASGASRAVVDSRAAPWLLSASHTAVSIAPMELKAGFRRQYEAFLAARETKKPPADTEEGAR